MLWIAALVGPFALVGLAALVLFTANPARPWTPPSRPSDASWKSAARASTTLNGCGGNWPKVLLAIDDRPHQFGRGPGKPAQPVEVAPIDGLEHEFVEPTDDRRRHRA
jgi:hypothetical protein